MWLYTGLDQRTIFKYATSSSSWFSHASFKALNCSIALALWAIVSALVYSHHWYHQHSQLQLLLSSQNHCSLVELFSDPEWVWWWQSLCFLQHFSSHLWHIYYLFQCVLIVGVPHFLQWYWSQHQIAVWTLSLALHRAWFLVGAHSSVSQICLPSGRQECWLHMTDNHFGRLHTDTTHFRHCEGMG